MQHHILAVDENMIVHLSASVVKRNLQQHSLAVDEDGCKLLLLRRHAAALTVCR
jgi:hypothetical protein